MKNKKENNLTRKNYVRQLRVLVFFGFLFCNHAFSQHIKSDSLIHQREHTSQFSKSEIIVINGDLIDDPSNKSSSFDDKLKQSKPIIYVAEGSFIYAPKNSIQVSIVRVVSHTKNEVAAKVLAKKAKMLPPKNAVENKAKRYVENTKTYTSSSDDSSFGIGTITKNAGIFYNTVSKSKKANQHSTEYPICNHFRKTQKRNSIYGVSFYSFQNCECHFTRPPPYFS